jgi:hypothetical protein
MSNNVELPPGRTLNQAFAERGIPDVIKIEAFPLMGDQVSVFFEEASSSRRQGVWLKTDGGIFVNGKLCGSVDLWMDSSPAVVDCRCVSANRILYLYNIWERDGVRSSLAYSSGMRVEEIRSGRRYRCNDIGFDTRFDSLIFRVENR